MTNTPPVDHFVAHDREITELRAILPKSLLEQERSASFLRWHAYRFMSAMECTRQFARDYESAFTTAFGMRCEMRPTLGAKEFETLWRMRQAADEMMISYPLYLAISFHQVRRKDPIFFARPHLIFARRQKGVLWLKLFKKLWAEQAAREFTLVGDMPEYDVSSYRGAARSGSLPYSSEFFDGRARGCQECRQISIERRVVSVEQALGALSETDSGAPIVWHARRNTEMLAGIVLRRLGANIRLVFTSAGQRSHTRYTHWLMRQMDTIVYTSAKSASFVPYVGPIIGHGVDVPVATEGRKLRRGLGLDESAHYIASFGAVRPSKGTDLLVDTLIELLPARPSWNALIVGPCDARDRPYLNNLIVRVQEAKLAGRIQFLGYVNDTASYLQAVDILRCSESI